MSYRLKSHEKLSHGIRRIARRQVLGLRKCLKDNGKPLEAIHKARLHIKKLRALVRLVRHMLSKKSYRDFDRLLKDIAKSLSPLRDAHVQLDTLQTLTKSSPRRLAGGGTVGLRTALASAQRLREDRIARKAKWRKRQIKKLLWLIETWSLNGLKKKTLKKGISRTRNWLQTGLVAAQQMPTVKNLHEWRKAAKDLANQLAVVGNIEPVGENTMTGLKKLGQLLGDDHDLAMFELRADGLRPPVRKPIQSVIRKKRMALQRAAFELGRKQKDSLKPVQFPCK